MSWITTRQAWTLCTWSMLAPSSSLCCRDQWTILIKESRYGFAICFPHSGPFCSCSGPKVFLCFNFTATTRHIHPYSIHSLRILSNAVSWCFLLKRGLPPVASQTIRPWGVWTFGFNLKLRCVASGSNGPWSMARQNAGRPQDLAVFLFPAKAKVMGDSVGVGDLCWNKKSHNRKKKLWLYIYYRPFIGSTDQHWGSFHEYLGSCLNEIPQVTSRVGTMRTMQ